jgi:hypothetical protein
VFHLVGLTRFNAVDAVNGVDAVDGVDPQLDSAWFHLLGLRMKVKKKRFKVCTLQMQ